jgi:hypothetical protein
MGGQRVDTTTEAREDKRSGVRGADRRHLRLRPQRIADADFGQSGFFDPNDVVQVKYEMLRRHRVDGLPVTAVAALFGVSRQTFYAVARAFDAGASRP